MMALAAGWVHDGESAFIISAIEPCHKRLILMVLCNTKTASQGANSGKFKVGQTLSNAISQRLCINSIRLWAKYHKLFTTPPRREPLCCDHLNQNCAQVLQNFVADGVPALVGGPWPESRHRGGTPVRPMSWWTLIASTMKRPTCGRQWISDAAGGR